jgi:hypothetical protein
MRALDFEVAFEQLEASQILFADSHMEGGCARAGARLLHNRGLSVWVLPYWQSLRRDLAAKRYQS